MNLILEGTDRVPFFTDMRATLHALGISASAFDWYLSDIETNYYGEDFSPRDQWITGIELRRLLECNEIQFIWAVFSAVPVGHRHTVLAAPYIEGNPDFWTGSEVRPQLQGAVFEIACWDSSATILVGLPEAAQKRFLAAFPETDSLQNAVLRRVG
ncbi:hypothetical protein F3K02_15525 [Hydrogenophaga sp. D2P1]|uniref:Uncharacterized protein n=1 Tax=Hydrogenophaga aromaticivorans TaxID=2610898 RepID=A0A7Y8KZ05_9BURK|nr:hypothetical protein [Hydrogenophaga aromaticivorans]NWF46648.1 hypothetical protein [Hydrogenophaga aromaticivorans]